MTEGLPFRAVVAGSTGLAGLTVGAGWYAAALDLTGKLSGEAQVVVFQVLGLIIVTAEVGVILIVLLYLRSAATLRRSHLDATKPVHRDQRQPGAGG
jgi:hypothetical protein